MVKSRPSDPAAVLRRAAAKAKREKLEGQFFLHLRMRGAPPSAPQHQFHPTRKWRFDFAWPEQKVAVEVDGGTWSGGRHVRAAGYEAYCQKINAAVLLGWRVLRGTGGMVRSGELADAAMELLESRP